MTNLTDPIFADETAAREHLEAVRWPEGPICPHCGTIDEATKLTGKSTRPGVYKCRACSKPFSVTVGTVYERSHIPLHKWLLATHLLTSAKKGMSAHQLMRNLGLGSYRTAWFMAHRIREAMRDVKPGPMGGEGKVVEADETYTGNKGRKMNSIEQSLHQTKHGNPQHFLIEGERGIGKSSLMLLASVVATATIVDRPFNFVVATIELSTSTTYSDLVLKIGQSLRRELNKRQHLRAMVSTTWEFISKWSVMGLEYKAEQRSFNPVEAIDDLASSMAQCLTDVGSAIDGILILIDEADKPEPQNANLGEFVKLLTERLTHLHCDRVCLGLAGLPIVTQKLRQGHESSLRVFETYMLQTLLPQEAEEVVQRGLEEANSKNDHPTKITTEALQFITHLAEGYPHFIQQFAYCAFDNDRDWTIDREDVYEGAFAENGALDQLGRKFFQEMYYERISSSDYRRVLVAMAERLDSWQHRTAIIAASGIKVSQVNNALNALKSRNIIIANEDRKGEYKLPTKSFAVWIKATSEKKAGDTERLI